jgi:hypothetical protein
VQVEALVQADAPAKPGGSFPVSDRGAEPMRTPPKRAPYRSGLAGTVRDQRESDHLTDRITMSDREVLGERALSRLVLEASPAGNDAFQRAADRAMSFIRADVPV